MRLVGPVAVWILVGCGPSAPAADADGDGIFAASDCDDTRRDLGFPATWYPDADGDGFGTPEGRLDACEAPPGFVGAGTDCDDARADVYPKAVERCDAAATDEDCDGRADDADPSATGKTPWFSDGDGDGYGFGEAWDACDGGAGAARETGDCDDARPDVAPNGVERCDPVGIDEDCDGRVDDDDIDVQGASMWYVDADEDGFGDDGSGAPSCLGAGRVADSGDCDDADPDVSPFASEVCSGRDEDCDGAVDDLDDEVTGRYAWYADADGDGFGARGAPAEWSCEALPATSPVATDCDDTDATIWPGAVDLWYDGVDGDCDGADDFDADRDGHRSPEDCDDLNTRVHGDAFDRPYDGVDADCDGADDYDVDGDGHRRFPEGRDCDDLAADRSPDQRELVDGVDSDCDGQDVACGHAIYRVPGDFASIQAAASVACDGDIIEVGPGVWAESVEIAGAVSLRGAGRGQTILDGEDARRPLTLASGASVSDLSVRRGRAPGGVGGCISAFQASIERVDADGCVGNAAAVWAMESRVRDVAVRRATGSLAACFHGSGDIQGLVAEDCVATSTSTTAASAVYVGYSEMAGAARDVTVRRAVGVGLVLYAAPDYSNRTSELVDVTVVDSVGRWAVVGRTISGAHVGRNTGGGLIGAEARDVIAYANTGRGIQVDRGAYLAAVGNASGIHAGGVRDSLAVDNPTTWGFTVYSTMYSANWASGYLFSSGNGSTGMAPAVSWVDHRPSLVTYAPDLDPSRWDLHVRVEDPYWPYGPGLDYHRDDDRDGLPDGWEQSHGGDLDPVGDLDGDGVAALREYTLGTWPEHADTDEDGADDGAEDAAGTDPLSPGDRP